MPVFKAEVDKINTMWEEYKKYIDQLIDQKNINGCDKTNISTSVDTVSGVWSELSEKLTSIDVFSNTMPEDLKYLKDSIEAFKNSINELHTKQKVAFPTVWNRLEHQLKTLCYKLYNYFFAGPVWAVAEGNARYVGYRNERHNTSTYKSVFFTAVTRLEDKLLGQASIEKSEFLSTTLALTS